ncbi:type II secretion system protein GspM [Methylomonas methanica]|uniref:General secretion pathway protein M n=1 Tax=Methylomonas methanica (strain DSM 25384 / MC09) TaxID=857087 RepID=G0A039_METMM|nr:type II secretion system protein GspM [Methylomonas methanica]AEG01178.1 General secretion pathway protein M [Methylomonas methanica MC09]
MNNVRWQRWLAVGLLLLVVSAVVFAVLLPLVSTGLAYHEEKKDLLFRLQRQQTIAGRETQVAAALEQIKQQFSEQGYFSTSTTEALASAELQNIVKTAVADAGGQLTSTQGLPGKEADGFFRVAVKVRMTGSMEALVGVLHSIETAVPVLLVDQLDINPVRGARNRKTNKIEPSDQLNVSFQVVSFLRSQAHE